MNIYSKKKVAIQNLFNFPVHHQSPLQMSEVYEGCCDL